jgi:hypothetical protein
MNKRVKLLLIVGAVAVAAYLAYRWYQNRQSGNASPESPTGGLGSNLNSVAPELVGGSAGPAVGPALSAPININLTEQVAPPPDTGGEAMVGATPDSSSTNALHRQNGVAKKAGHQVLKTGQMNDIISPSDNDTKEAIPAQPKPKAKAGVAESKDISEPGARFTAPEEM